MEIEIIDDSGQPISNSLYEQHQRGCGMRTYVQLTAKAATGIRN